MKDSIIGLTGLIASMVWLENAQTIVSVFCSLAIAIVTCGIQIYRLIRDKNKDKEDN